MHTLLYDLRHALRQLRRTPGLAVLAIVTLALGVGANTAIFTVIESVLLRPLPYAPGDRMVYIGPAADKPGFGSASWLDYRDIRAQSKLLSDTAGYSEDASVLEMQDSSQTVSTPHVTANLFPLLGVRPLLGRTFTEAEGQAGGPLVVILSENLWRESFHSDPGILGQAVKIEWAGAHRGGRDAAKFSLSGGTRAGSAKGVWMPLQPTPEMLKDRGYDFFNIVGELRPGVSVAAGAAGIGCNCGAHSAKGIRERSQI